MTDAENGSELDPIEALPGGCLAVALSLFAAVVFGTWVVLVLQNTPM